MAHIFLLAFAAAIYPTLLVAVVVVLGRPRPAPMLAGFFAGGMAISLTLGLAILFVAQSSGVLNGKNNTTSPALDLAAGIVSLLVALVIATNRDEPITRRMRARKEAKQEGRPKRDPWSERILSKGSAGVAFGAGMLLSLPSVYYIAGLKAIAEGSYTTVSEVLLIVTFNLIMFLLVEVPLLFYLLAPDRTRAVVREVDDWVGRHSRLIITVLAAAVGVYLVVRGVAGLAG